ncbi:glyoxalase superfamily protein [Chitinophaga sancti]|uniref:glyoxalase superfamily protein n=1 Tax=Chitinophaga sancti TaxID=1004 RepID=UPI003F7AB456
MFSKIFTMQIIPVFRVFDYNKTIEFYVNWLGCSISWEHRPDNSPFYLRMSLRGLVFDLSEHHGECSPGARFSIADFEGLQQYHEELLSKNYSYNRPGLERVEWAADTLEMTVTDPFSNRIIFNEKVKDFNTISPSAIALLFTKSFTQIPFMKEAVKRLHALPDSTEKTPMFHARVQHFEDRYYSIDRMLQPTGITNILELSSGYSFRGLDLANKRAVHYIDTDLDDVISRKLQFINHLQQGPLKGQLQLTPLNALDATQFETIIDSFPEGPVAIVNEGLLMYLNMEEKQLLADIIHKMLMKRGGCWITADIYIPSPLDAHKVYTQRQQKFMNFHKVEENKFASFDAAKNFFEDAGFTITKDSQEEINFRETWLLKTK